MPRAGYIPNAKKLADAMKGKPLTLWMPANLKINDVAQVIGPNLNLDRALSMVSKIAKAQRYMEVFKYRGVEYKNYEKYGFASVHSSALKKLGNKNYADYIDALRDGGIIDVYQYDPEYDPAPGLFGEVVEEVEEVQYIDKKGKPRKNIGSYDNRENPYTKGYRINEKWFPKNDTYYRYMSTEYTDTTVILALLRNKGNREQEQKLREQSRKKLAEMTNSIIQKSDPDFADSVVKGWYDTHQERRKSNPKLEPLELNGMHPQEAVLYMRDLKDEGCWITDYDDYGGRFHHSIAVTDHRMRCFYGGWSIDFKNSQFALLALCIENPEKVLSIVTEKDEDDYEEIKFAIDHLTEAYQKYEDVREFVKQAKAGTLYEWVASSLGYFLEDGRPDRARAKKLMFGVMFSGVFERYKQKLELQPVLGDLLEVCSYINDPQRATGILINEHTESLEWTKAKQRIITEEKMSTLPKMLQRFESRMMIDRFALVATTKKGLGDFTTIHDSVLCDVKDAELLESILREVFAHTGLPMPKVDSKQLNFEYPIN